MAETGHLRISDEDRERAAAAIREHFAAGRLDNGEVEERVAAVYAARTERELATLTADLPALPPAPPTRREELATRVEGSSRRIRDLFWGGGLFPPAIAVWLVTGAHGDFWPKYLLIPVFFSMFTGSRRRRRRWGRGGGGNGGGRSYSYRYEYRYGDGKHEHRHEHDG